MKKSHLFILLLIATLLMSSLLLIGDLSTYASVQEAKSNQGKILSVIGRLDTTLRIIYNPIKDPNFLSFSLVDSTGNKLKVVYNNAKPTDLEKSERLVIKGYMDKQDIFRCSEILMKCPSKYNDGKTISSLTVNTPRESES